MLFCLSNLSKKQARIIPLFIHQLYGGQVLGSAMVMLLNFLAGVDLKSSSAFFQSSDHLTTKHSEPDKISAPAEAGTNNPIFHSYTTNNSRKF